MNSKIYLLGFGILFLFLVVAQPPTFHQFYGNVIYENGTLVPGNVTIVAVLGGESIGEIGKSVDGPYGYSPLFFVEDVVGGGEISFYLNGYFSASHTFVEEDSTYLDLVYNESASVMCFDFDGDGYNSTGGACGPVDCVDSDPEIYPGRSESCATSYDDNCNNVVNEGCSVTTDDGSNSNSGSGSVSVPSATFDLDKTEISAVVAQGESAQINFRITDNGIGSSVVDVSSDLAYISSASFELPSGGFVDAVLNVNIPESTIPDVYLGTISVTSKGITKEIPVSVEVVSAGTLFDIFVTIPPESLYLFPGQNLPASYNLIPLTDSVGDVVLKYFIQNEAGENVFSSEETRTILGQENFVKDFTVPETKNGKYLLYTQLVYGDKTASASTWFNIGPRSIDNLRWGIIIGVVFIAMLIILSIIIVRHKKMKKEAQILGQNDSISS